MLAAPTLLLDLFNAYYKARKNKRNTINQLEFEINYESNLIQLHNDIVNRVYSISPSICFIVNKPVKREIFAAHFRDRVVHHLLFNYINPSFENQFIEDSYSCRKGKGTHYGISRLYDSIKECSQNYKENCYVLKLDIQSYFMSINKTILQQQLTTTITNANTIQPAIKDLSYYLIDTILASNPTKNCTIKGKRSDWNGLPKSKSLFFAKPNCGLAIGNLTSQLFSNIYLHNFDTFIKKEHNIKYYGRYVDDFYILAPSILYLKKIITVCKNYLKTQLGLQLHPKKIFLQHFSKGVNFLGATLKPHRKYVSNRAKINFKSCVHSYILFLQNTAPTHSNLLQIRAALNSYLGILRHYRTYNIRYNTLLKDRNNLLFKYGYVVALNNGAMIYKLHSFLVHKTL
ncbi:RNA-directed DNA polymerase [Polaribacter glomeratus]|nr:RNA-directed DNA polymerase [Polaribacter glomeratus]